MKRLFIAFIASLVVMLPMFATDVLAVTCNKCNSLLDQRCTSTLTYDPPTCTGGACFTFTGTASGTYTILRDCSPFSSEVLHGACTPMNTQYAGVTIVGTYCFCISDHCNGGVRKTAPINPFVERTTVRTRPIYMHPTIVPTVKAITALAATNAAPTQSVTCNKCISLEDPRCGSTITYKPPTCTGAACVTFTGTASGRNAIARDCVPSWEPGVLNGECMPLTTRNAGVMLDGNFCFCSSNYCNGGVSRPAAAATPANSYSPGGTSLNNQGRSMARSRNAASATQGSSWSLRFVLALSIWLNFLLLRPVNNVA